MTAGSLPHMRRLLVAAALLSLASMCGAAQTESFSVAQAARLKGEALVTYARAWVNSEPDNIHAWRILNDGYIQIDRPDLGVALLEAATKRWPKRWKIWWVLGTARAALHHYVAAENAFHQGLRVDPHVPVLWENLVGAYSREPGVGCRHPRFRSPTSATSVQLANCEHPFTQLKMYQEQESEAGPYQDYRQWYNLANGFLSVGIQAQEDEPWGFVPLERQHPTNGELAYLEIKANVKAIKAYQQTLRMKPNYSSAWNNMANAEVTIGHWQEAFSDYRKAIALGDELAVRNYKVERAYYAYGTSVTCIRWIFATAPGSYTTCTTPFEQDRTAPIPISPSW